MDRRAAVVLVALMSLAPACGRPSAAGDSTPSKRIHTLSPTLLPDRVLGLKVTQEDVTKDVQSTTASYADAVGLFAFRNDADVLQATLQATRFNNKANYRSAHFRNQLILKVGGPTARVVRLGSDTVYLTAGTNQQRAIWFRGRLMFLMAIRDDYTQPRTLLRQGLEVKV